MHLYEEQWTLAELIVRGQCEILEIPTIPWFQHGDDLIEWLWEKADGTGILET
jgi:hypothetical protein